MSKQEQFLSLLMPEPNSGCWIWLGAVDSKGYGVLSVAGKSIRAHRYSYLIHKGPIPQGLHVLHKCDNPPCANPDHLTAGTHGDNMADMARKGRHGINKFPGNWLAGEDNPSAKLTASTIQDMAQMRAAGSSLTAIGKRFGVFRTTVARALSKTTYRDTVR